MVIRRAVYDPNNSDPKTRYADVEIIRTALATLPNPPNIQHPSQLVDVLLDDNESIFIDDVAGIVARVTVLPDAEEVCLWWLLPHVNIVAKSDAMRAVAQAAEKDALARHPKAADWVYHASPQTRVKGGATIDGMEDKGEVLLLWWQRKWPSTLIDGCDGDRCYIHTTLRDASDQVLKVSASGS